MARAVQTSRPTSWLLRVVAIGYVFLLVAWPVGLLVQRTFSNGLSNLADALSDPETVHALQLSGVIAFWATVINLVFGVTISVLLVRYEFPGKRALSALIDLPLSVSPVVVGLALVLAYNGRDGVVGPFLGDLGVKIIFTVPGMIMATCFVALPLVVREVVPVLTEIGDDQEQAARSLGANARQTFWRITLPSIKWAVAYGVVLSLGRAVGEFGAVKVVSSNVAGQSQTATLAVEAEYQNFNQDTAYAIAFLLILVGVACLVVVAVLRPSKEKS